MDYTSADAILLGSALTKRSTMLFIKNSKITRNYFKNDILRIIFDELDKEPVQELPIIIEIVAEKKDLKKESVKEIIDTMIFHGRDLSEKQISLYLNHLKNIYSNESLDKKLIEARAKIGNVPVHDIIIELSSSLSASFDSDKKGKGHKELIVDTIKDIFTQREPGVKTGFNYIDEKTGGLREGRLAIISAGTGVGKTAFALNILSNIVRTESKKILFFSFEMEPKELMGRMLAFDCDIDFSKIMNHKLGQLEMHKIREFSKRRFLSEVIWHDSATYDCSDIEAIIKHEKIANGCDIAFVDYIQIIKEKSGENQEQRLASICKSLRLISSSLKVTIVALAQINRNPNSRSDKTPMIGDIRGSSAIEHYADLVIFLNRQSESDYQNIKLTIAKNRTGGIGSVKMTFRGNRMKFTEKEDF